MDKEIKLLLVEVAKAVLKVLDAPKASTQEPLLPFGEPAKPSKRVVGVVAKINDALSMPAPSGDSYSAAPMRSRGDYVRFWDGNRYVVGEGS